MIEKWCGDLVGKMFRNKVTRQDLADELGVTKQYVSMLLNGERTTEGAKERLENAYNVILERRKGN